MDTGDPTTGVEVTHQNGVPNSDTNGVIMEKVSGVLNTIVEFEGVDESAGAFESLAEKDVDGSTFHEEFTGLTIAKESREEEDSTNNTDNFKKGQGRGATVKPSNRKTIVTSVKKNKVGKFGSVTLKKPFALATNQRSSNDRQVAESIHSGRANKVASAASAACHSQRSEQSCTVLPVSSTTEMEGLREQAKQEPPDKVVENTYSASLSPAVEGSKTGRVGGLPSYGFSFKCDERAQKRKEFYLKLEEKVHAKEVERTTLQAKSKETQEAEMKMLRRSLTFKATPMPNFYHEPPPPKLEPKKIPPTRAKSPKLGRHKRSPLAASEGYSSQSSQSSRLSLDEKVTQTYGTKELSPKLFKKPLRKSLPRLPSEKTKLANSTEGARFITQHLEQHTIEQESGQISEPRQSQTNSDIQEPALIQQEMEGITIPTAVEDVESTEEANGYGGVMSGS